tara:strand:+ start:436 stop:768 length:333 start_codon:yes stop_codon:yes gene_type:complete
MKVKDFLKSKGIDGYRLELSTEEKGWGYGNLKTLLKDYKKQLILTDVGCSYFTTSDIGSKFKVIKSNQWHNFKLGETVTLKCVTMAEDDEYKFESENDYWYLGFTDVEKL